jgi:hypothetical protein
VQSRTLRTANVRLNRGRSVISETRSRSSRAGPHNGRHASLDGGDHHGISLGHAISFDGHEMRDSSGRRNPLQLLFADRVRPTSTCCPLADGTQRSPEPLRLQATPEFGTIATAAAPLALKEQMVRVERALPRLEDIGSSATQRPSNEAATVTQAADSLLDRRALSNLPVGSV